jgi:osmotically-inducible protein OsmY
MAPGSTRWPRRPPRFRVAVPTGHNAGHGDRTTGPSGWKTGTLDPLGLNDNAPKMVSMTHTMKRADADLKQNVEDELSWLPSVNSNHIGVSVDDGAVTLTGHVQTYPQKVLAGKAALRVRGVTAIAQEIEVHSTWSSTNDTDIAREAGEALDRSVTVPDEVTASVHNHVVTLAGEVKWRFERQDAVRAVHYLKGVVDVVDGITLRPTVSAAGVKETIQAALLRNAQFEGKFITVTTEPNGHITLAGNVRSWAERRQAEQVSWSAPGVSRITNNLKVTL